MKPLFDEYNRRNAILSGSRLNVHNIQEARVISADNTSGKNTTFEVTFDRAINEVGTEDLSRVNGRNDRISNRMVEISRPTVRELLVTTGILDVETGALTIDPEITANDTQVQANNKFKGAFAALCNFGNDINVVYISESTLRVISKPNAYGCRGYVDVSTEGEPSGLPQA